RMEKPSLPLYAEIKPGNRDLMKPEQNAFMGTAALLGAGWLLVALFMGETQLLATLPGPAPQAVLWTLTMVLLLAAQMVRPFRQWLTGIPLKALIAVHLTRFAGIYFLYLHVRGELPRAFAVPAGYGDILAAVGA